MSALTDADRDVLYAYADNDMNVSKTARNIFMNRSCVDYHLLRVHQKTGLDPYRFHDLVELMQRTVRPAKGVTE